MLDELDKELESRGHKFVRYADDVMILCRSKRSASRVMESITKFVEGKLMLKVNKEKSVVGHVSKIKFLGYSSTITEGSRAYVFTLKV
jgi:retron-type reverse transcriptase